ncbi:MAG: hypothetical protein OSB15_01630 [Amylibacter sp.]|nr:hypothetical protein [Amylibacter sp.]|tara:strand:+ start:480 stop:719 length:240 start_codon:yes stop_codon:yes gene_type:complete
MKQIDKLFSQLRLWLFRSSEILGLITVLFILIYLLLGEDSGDYVISVMANLSLFVSAVTPEAIIGIAIVVGLFTYLRTK